VIENAGSDGRRLAGLSIEPDDPGFAVDGVFLGAVHTLDLWLSELEREPVRNARIERTLADIVAAAVAARAGLAGRPRPR
jgi:hypothetical protein